MAAQIRSFLSVTDLTPGEFLELLNVTREVKTQPDRYRDRLRGRTLAMIFQKPSTRTRVSFEVGMLQLGGHALHLSARDLQLGRGETIADTARVLSRYVDVIMARVFAHQDIETLARYASVPVINGLSDLLHPCQALADMYTILEKKGGFQGLRMAYVGDGNNVCHSLLLAAATVGLVIHVATPPGYEPRPEIVEQAQHRARDSGASIYIDHDPDRAVSGADVVYTDVWASMGQESERETRLHDFRAYQIHRERMERAKPDAIFLHCLPAHRGEEVTDAVIDGPWSAVWDQAENRLHTQKALLLWLFQQGEQHP